MHERTPKPARRLLPAQRAAAARATPAPHRDGAASAASALPRVPFTSLAVEPQARRRPQPNRTGLPDRLKSGIEGLSGVAMDDVRVHYNSPRPPKLGALAFAQGREIHLAPAQERHLPHEAWHLVQQARGRVRPTLRLGGGIPANGSAELEREADIMGAKALNPTVPAPSDAARAGAQAGGGRAVVQRQPMEDLVRDHPALAKMIFSFLPAGDLATVRSVSKSFKAQADETSVEGGPLTMGELTEHFSGFTPTGLHGASSKDAKSLYGGVSMGHESNYEGSKLGPGFYMTEGNEPIEQRVAGEFASKRVTKVGGTPDVYRVLTRNKAKMTTNMVQPGPWLKTKPPSKELRPDFRGGDLLRSTLTDMQRHDEPRPPRELKVAPHLISPTLDAGVFPEHKPLLEKNNLREEIEQKRKEFGLEVLPPSHPPGHRMRGVLGSEFLEALHARKKK